MALPASAADDHGRHHRPAVYISDVQYDSPGRDDGSHRSLYAEWVGISNDSRRAANLDGWSLSDERVRPAVAADADVDADGGAAVQPVVVEGVGVAVVRQQLSVDIRAVRA